MRTLYFKPGLVSKLPSHCAVLHVSALLRELILETVRVGRLRVRNSLERALRDLAISHLESASPVPTFITLPREPRALAVARRVVDRPAQPQGLAALCAGVGVSVRTIQRTFLKDIGLDFETWRRQVRLTKAVELLVEGHPVKEVAFAVGYRQCSAFTQAFRRTFGTAPKSWLAALERN